MDGIRRHTPSQVTPDDGCNNEAALQSSLPQEAHNLQVRCDNSILVQQADTANVKPIAPNSRRVRAHNFILIAAHALLAGASRPFPIKVSQPAASKTACKQDAKGSNTTE